MNNKSRVAAAIIGTISLIGIVGCSSDSTDTTENSAASDAPLADLVPAEFQGATLNAVNGDSNPPMYFRGESDEIEGITIDLAQAAAELLGVELDVTANSFDSSIPGLLSQTYDISLWATDVTDERKQIIDQIPIGSIGYAFLANASAEPTAESEEALCGATIAAIAGQTTVPLLEEISGACTENGGSEITISTFPDQAAASLAVKSGRADLATVNSVSGTYVAENDPELQLTGPIINPHFTGIATAKGNGLGEAFTAALQELVENGTYEEIVRSHGAESMLIDEITLNPATVEAS